MACLTPFFFKTLNRNKTDKWLRLGVRAHDIGCMPADDLARAVALSGYDCVQLAPAKAIQGVDFSDGIIPDGLAREIGSAFARHDVGIEVLGCYINPIHPDLDVRRSLHGLFKQHLRHARDFGCGIVALESGSLNADYSPHPENGGEDAFHRLVDVMDELVAEAGRCGVSVGIEGVWSHVLNTPERMLRLLEAIPSPHLRVVLDPVNFITMENHGDPESLMRGCMDAFGERVSVIHAKDFHVEGGVVKHLPAGGGVMDYGFLLDWIRDQKPGIAVILEECGGTAASAFSPIFSSGGVRAIP